MALAWDLSVSVSDNFSFLRNDVRCFNFFGIFACNSVDTRHLCKPQDVSNHTKILVTYKFIIMKKIILLFLFFCNIYVYGQLVGPTMSVVSTQATPVSGGINVNLQTYCSTVMYSLGHTYTITDYQINLSTCYHITPLLMPTSLNENFFIQTPDSGNYVVNLTVYSSLSNSACDYSTVQDNRNLTLSNENFNIVNNDLKLYPNPTNGFFQIDAGNQTINSMKFYNSLGQLVKISNDLNNDISNLKSGIYYIVIETENASVTKKIMLQK